MFHNLFSYVQSNKDYLKKISRSKGEGLWKYENWLILGQGIHVAEWSLKKEYGNFPFSHDIILKQNYIVKFISLSLVNTCQNYIRLFLDLQFIVNQEKFQHKILNWWTFLSLLSLHTSMAEKKGQEVWELSINSE